VDAAGGYTYYASPGFYKEQLCLGGTCVTRTVLMPIDAGLVSVGEWNGAPVAGSAKYPTIQEAVDAIGSTGGRVYVLPGAYDERITSIKEGIHLICLGSASVFGGSVNPCRIVGSSSGVLLTLGDGATTYNNGWIIEGISFEDTSGTGALNGGVRLRWFNRTTFRKCAWKDFEGTGDYGVWLDGTGDAVAHTTFYEPYAENNYDWLKGTVGTDTQMFGGEVHGLNAGVTFSNGGLSVFGTGFKIPVGGAGIIWNSPSPLRGFIKCEGTPPGALRAGECVRFQSGATGGSQLLFTTVWLDEGAVIDASAQLIQVIGNCIGIDDDNCVNNSGDATFKLTRDQIVLETLQSAIAGQAGFKTVTEPDGISVPALLVNLSRGILVKDDPTISGGLWLSGDAASQGTVGAGAYGDLASNPIATDAESSSILFWNNEIRFYADTGLTPGNSFNRTLRGEITPTSAFFTPLEGSSSNTAHWIFKLVDFSDMTAGATADTFTLWTLPTNTMIHDVVGIVVTGWSGGTISAAVCSVGTQGGSDNDLTLDDNFFATATVYELHDATANGGKGTLLYDATDKFAPYMFVAGGVVEIQCDLTGDNHANATAGQARIYILVSRPLENTTREAN
jgi:hypothetical protein